MKRKKHYEDYEPFESGRKLAKETLGESSNQDKKEQQQQKAPSQDNRRLSLTHKDSVISFKDVVEMVNYFWSLKYSDW